MSFILLRIRQLLRPQLPSHPQANLGTILHHDCHPTPTPTPPSNADSFLDMGDMGSSYRSELQGKLAMLGLVAAICFSFACVVVGMCIFQHTGTIRDVVLPPGGWRDSTLKPVLTPYTGVVAILPGAHIASDVLSLFLNFLVTIFTESIGYIHFVALKSTLAAEARLEFNTNPRLFPSMGITHWKRANGPIFNIIMSILLTISYSSSSLWLVPVISRVSNDGTLNNYTSTCIFAPPVTILGVSILLQALIAIYSIITVKVLTWSASPFDTTMALLRNGLVTRRVGRSMHTVVDQDIELAPSRNHQPSSWESHPFIWKVITFMWLVTFACVIWGGCIYAIWTKASLDPSVHSSVLGQGSWSLFPNPNTLGMQYSWGVDPARGTDGWPWLFAMFAAAQGSLTFGLHCAEVNVNVARDEFQWRQASTVTGMAMSRNPFAAVLGSWPNVALLGAKPLLHWLFGLSLNMEGSASPLNEVLLTISLIIRPIQIWYLAIALLIFTTGMTFLAFHHPRGLQPAAFGHIQTLMDVIDVWAPKMWWGYKVTNESTGHAGTSDWPLPPMTFESGFV